MKTSKAEVVPARCAQEYRMAFLESVTADDVRAIGAALLERAKAGDPTAARLVLDRLLGGLSVERWPSRGEFEKDAAAAELLGGAAAW